PSGDLTSNLVTSSLPFLISTAAFSEVRFTFPKSMPSPTITWLDLFLSSGFSLVLPSPNVQPLGHDNLSFPSVLSQSGNTFLPDLLVVLGRSTLSARSTLPVIGKNPEANMRIGRLAPGRSSPSKLIETSPLPNFRAVMLPSSLPAPIQP